MKNMNTQTTRRGFLAVATAAVASVICMPFPRAGGCRNTAPTKVLTRATLVDVDPARKACKFVFEYNEATNCNSWSLSGIHL